MLAPITIRYPVRPVRRSLATARVLDLFGLAADEPPHPVADGLSLDIRPGDVALFVGPSGGGKSSLLRAVGRQLGAVDVNALSLPDTPLIDALPGSIEDRLAALGGCGLGEARLMLRTPAELSDGQRWRFRLALALADPSPGRFLLADEFAAVLDRTTAKVLAFSLRKRAKRAGVGVLAATTHDDIVDDLIPDVLVRCHGEGRVEVERRAAERAAVSFAGELRVADGTRADWDYFARWHYRSHHLAFVRRVVVLWHGEERVGVCVFGSPAASLSLRSKFFGLRNPRDRAALAALNEQLWVLQRVVLHPTYRGAGIAAGFVRQACGSCPVDWIETLSAMGHANPFFERAGFVRVGVVRKASGGVQPYRNGAFGSGQPVSVESAAKSRFSEPVYYVFDNRIRSEGRT
jgi:ABC-type ATPase with predicted acetyltransferase domain